MQLFYAPPSPFARKVRCVWRLLELDVTETAVNPYDNPPALLAVNPLGKVPALVLEDGTAIFDSPLIVQVLDDLAGHRLLPPAGPARWRLLAAEVLADAVAEAAVARTIELRRPPEVRSPEWQLRQEKAILRCLDSAARALPASFGLPAIALACALEYIDLRHDDMGWRRHVPELAAWLAETGTHPLLQLTRP